MDKKSNPGNNNLESKNNNLESLCYSVEKVANFKVTTSKQFEQLVELIYDRTGCLLSSTTLKRIWGYLNERVEPRLSTLDVLAQFCGWKSYEDFLSDGHQEIESGYLRAQVIRADENIKPGERLKLFWHPSRTCEVEYLGSQKWRVISSNGPRINPGDTFRCSLIIDGEPLYLDNLCQAGIPPGVYVCGKKSGVRLQWL